MTTTAFHADLVPREFGSHLLAVADLQAWAQQHRYHLQTDPQYTTFEFVQVEWLLNAVGQSAYNLTEEEAWEICRNDPELKDHRGAREASRTCNWLLSATAGSRWRKLLNTAVERGELQLLEFGSKLPVAGSTMAVSAETSVPDPQRRLARLRALGGDATRTGSTWRFTEFNKLVVAEKEDGRARHDAKTIRADLKLACEAERSVRTASPFDSLGAR